MHRLLLIPVLFVTGLASGLVAFVLIMFAWMAGLEIAFVAIAAVATCHAYLCGLTLQQLRRGNDQPWAWVGVALICAAATAGAIFRFA